MKNDKITSFFYADMVFGSELFVYLVSVPP